MSDVTEREAKRQNEREERRREEVKTIVSDAIEDDVIDRAVDGFFFTDRTAEKIITRLREKGYVVIPAEAARVIGGDEDAPLCGVCVGHSPSWDGHDVNPPCIGYHRETIRLAAT